MGASLAGKGTSDKFYEGISLDWLSRLSSQEMAIYLSEHDLCTMQTVFFFFSKNTLLCGFKSGDLD